MCEFTPAQICAGRNHQSLPSYKFLSKGCAFGTSVIIGEQAWEFNVASLRTPSAEARTTHPKVKFSYGSVIKVLAKSIGTLCKIMKYLQ